MPPRPDPNPKVYSNRDKVDGTPYYKKRQLQPGFTGSGRTPVPGTPYNKKTPDDVKRTAQGLALQQAGRRYGKGPV